MNIITKFFHELWNPHCEHCDVARREEKYCVSCDVLKQENARLQIENDRLLDRLLTPPKPVEVKQLNTEELRALLPRGKSWNEIRRLKESEDREKARLMKEHGPDKNESIEDLEKELGVSDAGQSN